MSTDKRKERKNAAGLRIPHSSDGHVAIVRYLMTYCVCLSDNDYNKRAVNSLLKKLQSNKEDIDALIEIITTNGSHPDKCLTIPRTIDGRFQVATRKGFPHVVYGRIWRWGDVQKCQIIHIPSCRFGYDLQRDHICINPYHYERIKSMEEFYNILSSIASSDEKRSHKNEAYSQSNADNDERKKQGIFQQPSLQNPTSDGLEQSQDTYQLKGDKLIPIVVEHQSNATEYIEPQQPLVLANCNEESTVQPQNPESYIKNANNIESTVASCSTTDKCDNSNKLHNLHPPAIENNSHQRRDVQKSHGHNQNNTPLQLQSGIQQDQNNFIQDNRNADTSMVSLSMCEQVLLEQSDFQNLSLSTDQRQNNFQQFNNLSAPSSSLIVNNSPLIAPLPNCSQQSQDLVLGNVGSVHINEMPPPSCIPLLSNSIFANNKQEPQDVQSNFRIMQINNRPLPSSTPLPNNPPTFQHNLFEDYQPTEMLTEQTEQLTNYNHELQNKDSSLNCTLERILAENNIQTESNIPVENTLNETLDQILSQVQNNNQKLLSADQKLPNGNLLLDNNTEPIITQSNTERAPNSNEELASVNIPIVVSNYQEMTEQNNNHQLQSTSNVLHVTQNIETVSSINAITPLSPISATTPVSPKSDITPLSPISAITPFSPGSDATPLSAIMNNQPLTPEQFQCDNPTLLLVDSNNQKVAGEKIKYSTNKEQLQSDKMYVSLNEDLQQKLTQNNNARQSTSHYFSDSMISFINNNKMEQSQMSSISKCEQYLRNQFDAKNSLNYFQPSTNDDDNIDAYDDDDGDDDDDNGDDDDDDYDDDARTYNEANNLNQTFQNNYKQNNAQKIHHQIEPRDKELQRNNMIEFFNMPNTDRSNASNIIPIDDPPLEHWCSIAYFEMDTQVGETFKVTNNHTTVVVDGYLDPDSGDRFCLGRLTNVNRTEQSERTRIHIAQGIALELRKDGDIWLRCKSKNSVFIQAHYLDEQSELPTHNSVHKIFSENCKKVFDLQMCYKHIKAQIATAQAALKTQLIAIAGRPINNYSVSQSLAAVGINVDDLRRLCILRVSFVKGWGPDYPRQTIKETPCWIEVHVHRALHILDEFLLLKKPIVRGMD